MNWNLLMHIWKTEGSECAKQALMQLNMKRLKQLAENQCVIQPYERKNYAGSDKKLNLVARILPRVERDIEAEDNPSESTLRRRFLNNGLRELFRQFRAAYPDAKAEDFWHFIQNSIPAQRWDNGRFAPSSITNISSDLHFNRSPKMNKSILEGQSSKKNEPQPFTEKIDGANLRKMDANLKKILYL